MIGGYRSSALGIAWRSLHNAYTKPAILFPSLIFPLFFLAAFAGGLSAVSETPDFNYPEGYTTFVFGFVLLQSSALGGVFTGFSIAADFQFGMGRRMMLATSHRTSIVVGYAITAIARVLATWVVITVVALLAGMEVGGSAAEIFGLYLLSLTINVVALLFAAGIALRLRTLQAGPLMQFPVFILLFLTPVYVPQELLAGWVSHVAKINPLTLILDTNREFLAGQQAEVLAAYGVAVGLMALLGIWAVSGMRRAETAG
ncbi:MAG TPA: ABC transporter permease [Solirubrobacterales bacterium]